MSALTNFSLVYFKHSFHQPGWRLAESTFQLYGLALVLKGAADYRINGSAFQARPGNLIFFRPGDKRFAQAAASYEIIALDFASQTDDFPFPTLSTVSDLETLTLLTSQIEQFWLHRQPGWQWQVDGLFLQLLAQLAFPPSRKVNYHVAQMKKVIAQNYQKPLTVAQLAQAADLSTVYAGSLFKASQGVTIQNYLNAFRIQTAAELLESSDQPIGAVAADCGFASIYYFSRSFKQHMHLTPKAYRQQFFE